MCFETKGGEEELSFSCRVGASTSRTPTEAAKKQGAKHPANERRKERARRRRKAWEERRRRPASGFAAGGAAAIIAAIGELASQEQLLPSEATATGRSSSWDRSSSSGRSISWRQEYQLWTGAAASLGAAAVERSSSNQQEQQLQREQHPSARAAVFGRSSRGRSC